jgi:hypothetical protein
MELTLFEQIALVIGKIILYGCGAAAIAYGVLKWFGQKWFENCFAQSLEQFKRKQSELLEQYRYQINAKFNRITKIHEKEFEVLPKAWYLLQDSYMHFVSVALPLQQWPNLNTYTPEQLDSFLETCELQEFQKAELRKQEDKLSYYQGRAYWARLGTAQMKFQEFRTYLRYNKIFLSRDLFDLFHGIEVSMIEAQVQLEEPDKDEQPWSGMSKVFKKLSEDVNASMKGLESAVQKRLHFDQV